MTDTASPSTARSLLDKYGFRCRKSLGQNFLVDGNIVNKIIDSAILEKEDVVLEIGPGLGVITRAAAARAGSVVALELDRALLPILEETLQGLENVYVVQGDAMEADFDAIVRSRTGHSGSYKMIANLPYYITTPLIMRILTGGYNVTSLVIMVQQEVAERITAPPGGRDYGALTVAVRFYTEARYLFRVPGTVFIPRPDVDSAVICLSRRAGPPVEVPDEELFFKVVRGSFGKRRKTLLNALGSVFTDIPREMLKELITKAGVDPGRRGETLDLGEFAGVTREIHGFISLSPAVFRR
ncbi:MAG: 16S rRNA (adenine(1518)-N(6)/adenine(1519)-N(6))-dimethyltransferase RsmA [Bacillota bacterium]